MTTKNIDVNALGQQALDIAREIIMSYYDQELNVEYKGDSSPVTIADKETETKVREFLTSKMDCGFIGEEWGSQGLEKDFVWTIDPIDGTKSFIRQVPLFGTLLACFYKGKPLWGAIDMSALDKRVWAEKGKGAWQNSYKIPQPKRIKVSNVREPEKSCLLTGTVNTFKSKGYEFGFESLRTQFGLYRGWGDCFGYYQVLTGKAEVMCDPVVSLWDIAPFPILFEEAGGSFTNIKGQSFEEMVPNFAEWKMSADTFSGLGTNKLWHQVSVASFK